MLIDVVCAEREVLPRTRIFPTSRGSSVDEIVRDPTQSSSGEGERGGDRIIVSVPASLPAQLYPPTLHQNFLVYVNPRDLHRFLLAWKRQNACVKAYTPSPATTLPCSKEWRELDWFKSRVPDQTQKRLHFIQSVNRPAPSTPKEHTAQTQTNFHVSGWATGPCKLKTAAIRSTWAISKIALRPGEKS